MKPAARRALDARSYPPTAYDDHWCLKPSWLMLAVCGYSVRHLLLVLIVYFPILPGQEQMAFLRELLSVPMTLAELPALLFLIAWRFRRPEAARPWRALWRHGRHLLFATLLLQATLMMWGLSRTVNTLPPDALAVVALLAQFGAIWYVWRSRRLQEVLRSYPEAALTPRGSSRPLPATEPSRLADVLAPPEPRTQQSPFASERLPLDLAQRFLPPQADRDELATRLASGAADSAPLWSALSMRAVGAEAFDEATRLIETAIALAPGHAAYYASLCEIQRRAGRLVAAIHAGRAAIRRDPQLVAGHYNLALALAEAGQRDAAVTRYRVAVRLDPGHAGAWNNLGVLYWQGGQLESARDAFARALMASPEMPGPRSNLAALAREGR